jgi:DMSO reductase anchor subunit
MELQWSLILFTTLIAACAGLFGTQAALAAGGQAKKSQMPAWIISAVLLVAGGIAVFFHLQHPERIFNGFGHITSGITQELIAIVVLAVVAIAYLVAMRRSDDGMTVPKALCWTAFAICIILICVCGNSYLMASRPAWDSILQILSLVGAACAFGPCLMGAIMAFRGDDMGKTGKVAVVCTAVALVLYVAYAVYLQASGGSLLSVDYYYDPTHPTTGIIDISGNISAALPLLWGGAVLLGGVVPLVCALIASRKNTAGAWKVLGIVGAVAALAGAICLRVVFYELGLTVFMLM